MFLDYDPRTTLELSNETLDGRFRREFYETQAPAKASTKRETLVRHVDFDLARARHLVKVSRYFRLA